MGYEVGARVGALMGTRSDAKALDVFGFGVYEGDFPFGQDGPEPAGAVADMVRDARGATATNPRIRLDSGAVVWGCECWWGPEDVIRAKVDAARAAGWTIVDVDIVAERAKVRGA